MKKAYSRYLASRQNTNHGSTKLAWYAAEAYQKGTIRYINSFGGLWALTMHSHAKSLERWDFEITELQNNQSEKSG